MEEFIAVKIEEDVDYGCEERPEGAPVMAVITIRDMAGEEQIIRYPDTKLYEMGVNEGDRIFWDPKTWEIKKVRKRS